MLVVNGIEDELVNSPVEDVLVCAMDEVVGLGPEPVSGLLEPITIAKVKPFAA